MDTGIHQKQKQMTIQHKEVLDLVPLRCDTCQNTPMEMLARFLRLFLTVEFQASLHNKTCFFQGYSQKNLVLNFICHLIPISWIQVSLVMCELFSYHL